ncbi:MAG TPA: hypothetical protein PKD55_19345 [Bellilinea sp.]|nr:hypothetical protein [Bellilinea sp.]
MRVVYHFWPRFYLYWADWNRFWAIYHLRAQVEDLEGLCTWAKRKRLAGPLDYYRRLLLQAEMRLHSHAVRVPRISRWAFLLRRVKNVLMSPPHHKGAAAKYRSSVIYKKPKFAIM